MGLTQSKLAKASNLSQSTISNMLRRTGKGYTIGTLRRLADVLKLDLTVVVEAHETEEPDEQESIREELRGLIEELLTRDSKSQLKAINLLRKLARSASPE